MLYGAFQKTVQTVIVLLIVSVASFGFLKLAPGDPVLAVMDEEFDQETYDRTMAVWTVFWNAPYSINRSRPRAG